MGKETGRERSDNLMSTCTWRYCCKVYHVIGRVNSQGIVSTGDSLSDYVVLVTIYMPLFTLFSS